MDLKEWWVGVPGEHQHLLMTAARADQFDTETMLLLVETCCPAGPVETKWESSPPWYDRSWPEPLRTFIANQR